MFTMPKQIFQELEFASREFQGTPASPRFAIGHIHFQIGESQLKSLISAPASEERSNARQKLRERKWFDEVIIGSLVEPFDSVLDRVTRGKYQHRSLQSALSQSGEHLEPVATWKHEIQ